ncbi:membrane protein implicated in regulation of membrane protease activity [Beggiatoa alba B18LD]|uniref:Membrane protein implicated in regulation of membrane protease activity n=1 Tax=Beggiatoa alba B18LD TaxID=395493 RepID=I3CE73_9GAMM|nr:NfeD family protein [Beggiatoa alba]EIJ41916.1 membrane protein implicated in regulation of membrane protease activity [Beggiatoa alba B18LD]
MMSNLQITFWYWWIFAIVLGILEVLAPTAVFIWSAIAAVMMGIVVLFIPYIGIEIQLIAFSVLSILSVWLGRSFLVKYPTQTDKPLLNQRGSEYVGRVFSVIEPISDGVGKVRIGDSYWRVEGADCPVGTKVKVIGIEGVKLRVEPFEPDES